MSEQSLAIVIQPACPYCRGMPDHSPTCIVNLEREITSVEKEVKP